MTKHFSVLTAFALSCIFCTTARAFNPSSALRNSSEKFQQKIKHPTEAMSDKQVAAILNNMRGKRNDTEKVAALKEGVKDKGITVEQLITLLNQFLTDDAKLESAQYAFQYTTNYKKYLKIMDLFSQEGYKWKLEEFYDKNKK